MIYKKCNLIIKEKKNILSIEVQRMWLKYKECDLNTKNVTKLLKYEKSDLSTKSTKKMWLIYKEYDLFTRVQIKWHR